MKVWAVEGVGGWVMFTVEAPNAKEARVAASRYKHGYEMAITKVRMAKPDDLSFYNEGIVCRNKGN